jgi:hypothetical protein
MGTAFEVRPSKLSKFATIHHQVSHPIPIHTLKMASSDPQGASYEAEHVHSVYEEIASHFSSTRYKVCVTL